MPQPDTRPWRAIAYVTGAGRRWHGVCERCKAMSKLLILAVFLVILWVILRVALAITGVFLHLLWVAAIILAIFWLVGKLRGGTSQAE